MLLMTAVSSLLYLVAAPLLIVRDAAMDLSLVAWPQATLLATAWGGWFWIYQRELSLARKKYLDQKEKAEKDYGPHEDWELNEIPGRRGLGFLSRAPEMVVDRAIRLAAPLEAHEDSTHERYSNYRRQRHLSQSLGVAHRV